jgi:acyl-CoA reductase-like NAD-dependent aldehyde dehydrogenase
LLRFVSLIQQHSEELALLESLDVGKPITDALNIDVPMATGILRFNAEAADKLFGKVFGSDASSLSYQLRQPFGVVGAIVGWNFPLVLAVTKIGPALAAGNSVVLKPSEVTPLSAARLAELAVEAGVPEGVFNVVQGDRPIGAALAKHREVDLLTFTGSTATGKSLLIASGQSNMKRLILECGGKAPNIVFEDAPDLESVARALVRRAFWNQGQVCTASSRLLVQKSIAKSLLPLVLKYVSALTPADPLKAETQFGALVSREHQRKVLDYIDTGQREGAQLAYWSDARAPFEGGAYVAPCIFDRVSPAHRIAQEEIFGPVLSVLEFENEQEAIAIANQTIYGLSAILWTQDAGRAHRVCRSIKAGWVVVNATAEPTGGLSLGVKSSAPHKQSGIGVEGGIEGLEAYTALTTVQMFVEPCE